MLWLTQTWLKLTRAYKLLSDLSPAFLPTPLLSLVLSFVGHTPPPRVFFHFFAFAKLFLALGKITHVIFSLGHPLLLTWMHTGFIIASFSTSHLTFSNIASLTEVFLDHRFKQVSPINLLHYTLSLFLTHSPKYAIIYLPMCLPCLTFVFIDRGQYHEHRERVFILQRFFPSTCYNGNFSTCRKVWKIVEWAFICISFRSYN